MISFLVAAIQAEPAQKSSQAAQSTTPAPPIPADLIRDIAPPMPVPMPTWQVVALVLGGLAVAALLVWLFLRWYQNRPTPPPPTPRSVALRDLEALRPQIRVLEPYQFSIAVSDVLRTYVGRQFGLPAREQTSPEFLAEIGNASGFTSDDRQLLGKFLGRCDLIKFARVQADETVSEELLASAVAFVHGGRA